MTNKTLQITDNTAIHRYEIAVEGKAAGKIEYRLRGGNVIDLIHTEVDKAFEGQGLASKLAKFALDDARAQGHKVTATCEYIAAYIGKHPEYRDLVQ
jgi:predicted GNAT family acetyltransferase